MMKKNSETTESFVPTHLQPFVAKQDPSLYTPVDQACWRFIMKLSQAFLGEKAHKKYLDGLHETGISSERIPLIREMDDCLKRFNWRAVAVTGFIPPAVFMEFLSLGILPIACDMRTLDHIAYTPAPDIVHEAAGHAPIIADPEYSEYLKSYGEVSKKAIYSKEDLEVYFAIRELSDVKEDPLSTEKDIQNSQARLDRAIAAQTYISEATYLSRMGWWTFEYGLIGDLQNPKIYGAGLLSSIGESFHCFDPMVKKIRFSIECIETTYDITRPQPQLFVAENFQILKKGLEELAERMAFRQGGMAGLSKALESRVVATVQTELGTQVSGVLTKVHQDQSGRPCYLNFAGPTQLSYQDHELPGQGTGYHREGFGTPLEVITHRQLKDSSMDLGKRGVLGFASGVTIEGKLIQLLEKEGKIILLTFDECSVKKGTEVLFRSEWGKYDIICGEKVVSVFGGPADRGKYLESTGGFHQEPGKQKTNLTSENRALNELYAEVRKLRESIGLQKVSEQMKNEIASQLGSLFLKQSKEYPNDWLLSFEILELSQIAGVQLPQEREIRNHLRAISEGSSEKKEIIQRGMQLLKK